MRRTTSVRDIPSAAIAVAVVAFPDRSNALKIALRCALEARRYDKACEHADAYLKPNRGDRTILYFRENLGQGTNLEDLKGVFTQRR